MYNAAQKEQFIREYSTKLGVRTAAQQLFDQVSSAEEKAGMDLCCMDLETLQEVFGKMARLRSTSFYTPYKILRDYTEWCLKNGVEGATDAGLCIDSADADAMKYITVRNPRHLQAFLDAICVPESQQTSDNLIRCYYWLAYAGLGDTEILTVTTAEVMLDTMTVFHDGKEYPIYREALPCVKNCRDLDSFRYIHPNYADKDVWRARVPGNLLMRGVRSVPKLGSIRVDLRKRNEKAVEEGKTDLKLSYYRVWMSGVFYRMYEDELAGFPPDFSGFVDDKLGDFQFKVPPKGNSQEYKRKAIAESYLADYERWKQTLRV